MRHLKSGRALGVKPAHRRAIMRNLVSSVLEHQQIRTTVARAKELRKPLDKMITLGKKGDLSARRRALRFVKSKQAMQVLFTELPERYKDRQGGYVRILRLGTRKGDGAEMALVQLVGAPNDALAQAQQPASRRRRRDQGKSVQEEVSEQVKGKGQAQGKQGEAEAAAAEEQPEEEAKAPEDQAPATEAAPESAEEAAAGQQDIEESEDTPATGVDEIAESGKSGEKDK